MRHDHAETIYAEVDRYGWIRTLAVKQRRPPRKAHVGHVWIPYPKILPADTAHVRFLWGDGRWQFNWKNATPMEMEDIDRLIIVKETT